MVSSQGRSGNATVNAYTGACVLAVTSAVRSAGDGRRVDATAEKNADGFLVAHAAFDRPQEDLAEVFGVFLVARIPDARARIEIPIAAHAGAGGGDVERVRRREAFDASPERLGDGLRITGQILGDHCFVELGTDRGVADDLLDLRAKHDAARAGGIEERALPHRITDDDDAPRLLVAQHENEVAQKLRAGLHAPTAPRGEDDRSGGAVARAERIRQLVEVVEAAVDDERRASGGIVERLAGIGAIGGVGEAGRARAPETERLLRSMESRVGRGAEIVGRCGPSVEPTAARDCAHTESAPATATIKRRVRSSSRMRSTSRAIVARSA